MSEAEYLESQSDLGAEEDCRRFEEEQYFKHISKMEQRYRQNSEAEVGCTINCAFCNKIILKKSYQTKFCSNKGEGNCKDKYWNNVDDTRRGRSHKFS